MKHQTIKLSLARPCPDEIAAIDVARNY